MFDIKLNFIQQEIFCNAIQNQNCFFYIKILNKIYHTIVGFYNIMFSIYIFNKKKLN